MKIMKKIAMIIIMVMMFIILFSINNISGATTYKYNNHIRFRDRGVIGDKIPMRYKSLTDYLRIYCIQHDKDLDGDFSTYKLSGVICIGMQPIVSATVDHEKYYNVPASYRKAINGNMLIASTDASDTLKLYDVNDSKTGEAFKLHQFNKYKTATMWSNAKLAYILYQNPTNYKKLSDGTYEKVPYKDYVSQNALWSYWGTWLKNAKENTNLKSLTWLSKIGTGAVADSEYAEENVNKILNAGTAYANFINDYYTKKGTTTEKSLDMTSNNDNITLTSYDNDHYLIGPYNIDFAKEKGTAADQTVIGYYRAIKDKTSTPAPVKIETLFGEIGSIEVYNQSGTKISATILNSSKATISASSIEPNQNFYIKVKKSDATNVSKIVVNRSFKVYCVKMTFIQNVNETKTTDYQDLIVAGIGTRTVTAKLTIETSVGNLLVNKVDNDNNNVKIPNVKFKVKNNSTSKFVNRDTNGAITYVDEANATIFETNANGQAQINNLNIGSYTVIEVSNPHYGYTANVVSAKVTIEGAKSSTVTLKNTKNTGNLLIKKYDANNTNELLKNVEFVLQVASGTNQNKYLKLNGLTEIKGEVDINKIEYVDTIEKATKLITNTNGLIKVSDLLTGYYNVIETKNPNYGYENPEETGNYPSWSIKVKRQLSTQIANYSGTTHDTQNIGNERIYTKISGYVWEDKENQSGKYNTRDDLYVEQTRDIKKSGVVVKLIDKTTGEIVKNKDGKECIKITDANGEYVFENVLIENLSNYYVEFEYNGQQYQNVTPHLDKENGSKAIEGDDIRKTFNESYYEITNIQVNNQENKGYGRNTQGEVKKNLSYTKGDNSSKYNYNDDTIQADTSKAGLDLGTIIINSQNSDIININLGIYERANADIALMDDINDVKLTINGYENKYIYNARATGGDDLTTDASADDGTGLNVGVKFGTGENAYGEMQYTTPIYRADAITVRDSKENKLQVYITYKTTIRNQSIYLDAKITELANYIDSRYTIVDSYIGDKSGNQTGDTLEWTTQSKYGDKYSQNGYIGYYANIENSSITRGQKIYVYTTLQLSDDLVSTILNEDAEGKVEPLSNVVEINSYAMFNTDGEIYGRIDIDSAPGNAIPGDKTTYEDDTDSAPALKLELRGGREVVGNVFEDNPVGEDFNKEEINTSQERLGNGIYDEETENKISGIKVELCVVNNDNTIGDVISEAITDSTGSYKLNNDEVFTPGRYIVRFTYADGTTKIYDLDGNEIKDVTTEEYKSTIQMSTLDYSKDEWYKDDAINAERYSDAKDNYDDRYAVNQGTSRTATTTNMNIGIEIYTSGGTLIDGTYVNYEDLNKLTNQIQNVDFGIIERAKQQTTLTTEIANIKVILSTGTPLVDYSPSDTEKVSYIKNGPAQWVGPDEYSRNYYTQIGNLSMEVDDELLHGSTLEITYKITAKNIGEADYDTKEYYYYGENKTNPVTTKVEKIVNYLDEEFEYDEEIQDSTSHWEIANATDLDGIVNDKVKQSLVSYGNTIITSTDLATPIITGEKAETTLKVSKTLTTSSEDFTYEDLGEIIDITTSTERKQEESNPGNYDPTPDKPEETGIQTSETPIEKLEVDTGPAPVITIIPPTGANKDYVTYGMVGIIALGLVGVGIFFIKKKVL